MKKLAFLMISLLFLVGCGKNADKEANYIRFSLENVEPIENAYYELAIKSGEEVKSIKKFNIREGEIIEYENNRALNKMKTDFDLRGADEVFINIVSENDKEVEMSFLSGKVDNITGKANLTLHQVNLKNLGGSYTLGTFTDNESGNETSGIWFVKKTDGDFTNGLSVQPLSRGWSYEGWINYKGMDLSLGRFGQKSGKDMSNPYSSQGNEINYPGEDFINNLGEISNVNLADGQTTVFITLEPDDGGVDPIGENPFNIVLLQSKIPQDLQPSIEQPMEINLENLPKGEAEIFS